VGDEATMDGPAGAVKGGRNPASVNQWHAAVRFFAKLMASTPR